MDVRGVWLYDFETYYDGIKKMEIHHAITFDSGSVSVVQRRQEFFVSNSYCRNVAHGVDFIVTLWYVSLSQL